MKSVYALAAMVFLAAFSFAQSSRIVAGTTADGQLITGYQVGTNPVQWQRQEIVSAPVTAPQIWSRHPYQNSNHSWNGDPFTKPFPGGTYEIYNASIDKQQKVGAWSSPAVVTVQSGAHLYCGGWNLPILQYESGVVWKAKCVSLDPEQAAVVTPASDKQIRYLLYLARDAGQTFDERRLRLMPRKQINGIINSLKRKVGV